MDPVKDEQMGVGIGVVAGLKIEDAAKNLQVLCKRGEDEARSLMEHPLFTSGAGQAFINQYAEMKDQIMLAVRHFEDARMRLGLVCQYAGDGVSILDKPPHSEQG